ncbi:MAG: protein kinase [Kofleriaceae bacterium]
MRRLARGGMADLFLARTVTDTFERLVVIKKILSRYADHPRFVQLFADEARLAKSLKHKNIVEVFDVGGSGGETFFAMEYLHGQDVRSILHRAWKRDEKMPIKHAVHVATQVASALSYAHSMRRPDGTLLDIVHRDVSPSNIIVSYDGAVKLLDFGVAKAATSSVKTRTGTLKGKIAYMSPEQAKGGSVDKRSDVFSLGICLWEMLTTSRLFRGENDLATLQLIINEAPKKPSEVNPEVPKDLERIVLRALAQDPAQRYQTAHELQAELEEFVRTQQMVQSSGALGMYMSVLFQPEIAAWKDAKAAGTQLSEHLTQVHEHKNELTTPISESEFIEPIHPDDEEYDDEEDIEDDLQEAAISGTIETKEAWPRRAAPNAPVLAPSATSSQPIPIGKAGSTPVVRSSAPALGPVIAPTLPPRKDPTRPPPTPLTPASGAPIAPASASPSGPVIAPTPSTPMPFVGRAMTPVGVPIMPPPPNPHAHTPTPTDGIPRPSWPPGVMNVSVPSHEGLPFSEEQAQQMRRQFYRIGGAVLALVFLIAIIKACTGGGTDDTKKPPPEPPPTTEPERTVTPPPPEPDAAVVAPAIPDAGATTATTPTTPPPEEDEPEVPPDAGSAAVPATIDAGAGSGSGSGSATTTKPKKEKRTRPRTNRGTGTYDLPTPPKPRHR